MKKLKYVIIVLGLIGCFSINCNFYQYPFSNVKPKVLTSNIPENYDECIVQFDSILKPEIIEYFKNQDSTVAVINIVNEIGYFFIKNWYLDYHLTTNPTENGGGYTYDLKYPRFTPPITGHFLDDSIREPQAMIRILFTGYHKYLNKYRVNWDLEIERFKEYWVEIDKVTQYSGISDTMKIREHKKVVDNHFKNLNISDTVDILYNRAPRLTKKSPDWYYLTGIIKFKVKKTKQINVELIEIKSEFGDKYILTDNDTIRIGDTLTDYSKGWLKRGEYYLNYYRNTEYRYGINQKQPPTNK